jgi:divalent metal cation (Fe/Co/Zn/Cd) transporter
MTAPTLERAEAVRRVRFYNNLTIGWNVIEGAVAIGAGIIAGSISLIAFGLDSGVEVSTSIVLAWRLAQERRGGCMAGYDRRATRWIAGCFAILAIYVTYEAAGQLLEQRAPDVSIPGIVIATASVIVMPVLARAKKRLGPVLGSQAVVSESRQTELCAWLSAVVLVGLGLNAVLGWWWADPVAALALAGFATFESVRTWRADSLEDTCCA